ncbi:ATP-binding cassette domain-containing protein [Kocuria coralli]|uniref:ATP-binding cassette domain-containing protein n=1 Tax=Kocuria coralli TaxID=1461025 RepID=A0A5J5KUI7_9MICC|nr:zinc ABC transporter ATP-binding protein AztA [Kocuria coralli]KAA9393323.1 ATP-binding cassette domain-containing protein [Kocuria coralli]
MAAPIRISELSCHYGRLRALTSVSTTIPTGTTTALVGANGSGKSTLLAVMAGTKKMSSSRIEGLPRNVAFVVQRSAVPDRLPITVREAVEMGRWRRRGLLGRLDGHDRSVVDGALEDLGIQDLAGRQLGEVSGGQRQRALIAQGLAQQAELLLLDEPLAAVDEETALRIETTIRRQRAAAVTVVLATHDIEQAARADRVIRLDGGTIANDGVTGRPAA